MRIVAEYGNEEVAKVYVASLRDEAGRVNRRPNLVEFVESVQPPIPREKKWVLIVSSMFGCPIRCRMCDAGGDFAGKLTAPEILMQVDHMVRRRFPDGRVPIPKFKIQFARMGEPALNPAVLDAMTSLPDQYDAPGLNVSISSVAPKTQATREFFERLLRIKEDLYPEGRFQLQFSIHTTDPGGREDLIPCKKWSFVEISAYGARFSDPSAGDKKVTLNFAPAEGFPIDASIVRRHFDPEKFMIKLTPLNPTVRSREQNLSSAIDPNDRNASQCLVDSFRTQGFDVILSIGELEENKIGSNCGQFIQRALAAEGRPEDSYHLDRYKVRAHSSSPGSRVHD